MDSSVLIVVIVAAVGLSLLVAVYAKRQGRDEGLFFMLSLALSPVIGFLIAAALGKTEKHKTAGRKKCPDCAELVQEEAVVCRYCGKKFAAVEPVAAAATESVAPVIEPRRTDVVEKESGIIPVIAVLAIIAVGLFIVLSIAASSKSKSSQQAREELAIGDMTSINAALITYSTRSPQNQFPARLVSLGPGGEDLLGSALALGVKDGYIFKYEASDRRGSYKLIATPALDPGRGFFTDETGVIRSNDFGVTPSAVDSPIH